MTTKLSKALGTLILLLTILIGCKSDDPAAPAVATGCNFTFKNVSYSLTLAPCKATSSSQFGATSTNANQILTLYKGGAVGTLIVFGLDIAKSRVYDSGSNTNNPDPTITIAGDTWTFNGILEDDNGDSGTISGKCTCTT